MTNTDNKYGVFNKYTVICSQINDGSTALVNFASVSEAKSWFFTNAALAVMDECCTQLQWALVGTTALKRTMAFGTKGGQISPADDWAEQYHSRFNSLTASKNWNLNSYETTSSDSHLF